MATKFCGTQECDLQVPPNGMYHNRLTLPAPVTCPRHLPRDLLRENREIRTEGTYTEPIEFKPFRAITGDGRVERYRKHMRGLKGLPMSPTTPEHEYGDSLASCGRKNDEAPETKSPPRVLTVEAVPERRHSTKHLLKSKSSTRTAAPAGKPPVPVQSHKSSSARTRFVATQPPSSGTAAPCSAAPKRRTGLMSAMRIFSR